MKLYRLITCCSIAFILTACSPAASTTTPTTTFEIPITPTAEITTVTPTPTEDPLAGGAPEGATGKNNKGEWIKTVTENGKPVEYAWNTELNGGFTSHVLESPANLNGGIPLIETDDNHNLSSDLVPLYIYVQEGVNGAPYIKHPNHPYSPQSAELSFTSAMTAGLWQRSGLSQIDAFNAYQNGTLSISFATPQGKEYIWKPGPNIGYKFYAIPWDDADTATHPEFFETPERSQFGDVVYRWTVYTEADGTLVVRAAVQDPASLTDDELLAWILNPMGTVLEYKQLPPQDKGWKIGDKSEYAERGIRGSSIHFEIVQSP